jgi:transcription initiation factor TFIIE subunit beta
VPNDVDLLKQLQSGMSSHVRWLDPLTISISLSGGLQETASEAPVIKTPVGKKKGKKSATRQRTARLTNTHLKDTGIDLSKDYVAPGK